MKVICLVLLALAHFIPGQGAHISSLEPAKRVYHVIEGENVLVGCHATGDVSIYWVKNDTKHPFRQNSTNLQLLNTTRDHAGDYICFGVNTTSMKNTLIKVMHLDVMYAAEVVSMTLDRTSIEENQDVTITCEMQGNPDPTWSIRNQDTGEQIFSMEISTFIITSIRARCESAGLWTCTGHNKYNYGRNATKGYDLTVYCSPRPRGQQSYTEVTTLGSSVSLDMVLLGYPRPQYSWTRTDGKPIRGFQIDTNTSTSLRIDNVHMSDFGSYDLVMTNDYGTYTSTYKLTADGPPQTPTDFRYDTVTGTSATLYWKSGFDMGSKQHFIVMKLINGNEFVQISENIYDHSDTHGVGIDWMYVLRDLEPNHFYNLSVVSYNEGKHMSGFAKAIHFYTTDAPRPTPDSVSDVHMYNREMVILGSSVGLLGLITLIILVIYFAKFRKGKPTYRYEKL